MKTIKIKDIEISAEELRRIVSENKELLKEPKVNGRYFFPREGEEYWYIHRNGFTGYHKYDNYLSTSINPVIELGVYSTKEQAQLFKDKQKAIVSCWKWAQENAPFEPDWSNDEQEKYCAHYCHELNRITWRYEFNDQYQFTLPYFKSEEDTEAFIKACKEHLTLLFTK